MSTQLFISPIPPGSAVLPDQDGAAGSADGSATPIGRQSWEFMDMADPGSERAEEMRQQLRKHVPAHPGFPERASLWEALETAQRNGGGSR